MDTDFNEHNSELTSDPVRTIEDLRILMNWYKQVVLSNWGSPIPDYPKLRTDKDLPL